MCKTPGRIFFILSLILIRLEHFEKRYSKISEIQTFLWRWKKKNVWKSGTNWDWRSCQYRFWMTVELCLLCVRRKKVFRAGKKRNFCIADYYWQLCWRWCTMRMYFDADNNEDKCGGRWEGGRQKDWDEEDAESRRERKERRYRRQQRLTSRK